MIDQLKQNFLGFVLLLAGVALVLLGTRVGIPKLSDSGFGFIGMAALALQVTFSKKDEAKPEEPTP